MSEYVESHELQRPTQDEVAALATSEAVSKAITKLESFRAKLSASKFMKECHQSFEPISSKITRIRCLALGSPMESKNALYQLAFLAEIAATFGEPTISVYDPVLTKEDIYLLETQLKYKVSKDGFGSVHDPSTLFFMPHSPLALTQALLDSEQPLYFVGNDIIAHTDRYTKAKLHDTYRTISLLVHLSEPQAVEKSPEEFTTVTRRRKKKNVFKEPEINYDYSHSYLGKLNIIKYKESFKKDSEWGNSFSDLALHIIEERSSADDKHDKTEENPTQKREE